MNAFKMILIYQRALLLKAMSMFSVLKIFITLLLDVWRRRLKDEEGTTSGCLKYSQG